jgi:nucleoside-diphosphate-sugar epimerase
MVPICLSLGIGKTFCIPPSSMIPTGASIAALVEEAGANALLTVPSILEEMASLSDDDSRLHALRKLDFIAFGGGIPKAAAGERLAAEGVKLINHYGATETGPLTPFFVPAKGHDWRLLRLRRDTLGPLEVRLDPAGGEKADQPGQAYKLSMRPCGWTERFELQDLLVNASGDPEGEFSISGRVDDLICLATGEKVRPTILEDALNQHESVKAVSAFGDQQFELGVLVEPAEPLESPSQVQAFVSLIWPTIEEANQHMDAHARISSPAVVVVVPPASLPRSDKGTVPRREAANKFADEIARAYRDLEASSSAVARPIDLSSPASSIRALIADHLGWCVPQGEWSDDRDFFELGMDSLQAGRLRRVLAASVKATASATSGAEGTCRGLSTCLREIPDTFVYKNPSIKKLVEALFTKPSTPNPLPTSQHIDELVDQYGPSEQDIHLPRSTVVLTGATGSLGAHFLHNLLQEPSVGRVICLNRAAGKGSPMDRQRLALSTRGLPLRDDAWQRVVVHATNTAAPHLGLSEAQYEQLAADVTHVAQMAWPMSFKMALSSFGASFRTLQNLLQLVTNAHCRALRRRPRMLFVSSFSTVGNYPSLKGECFVPETWVEDADCVLGLGYAQAKLVCERIIQRARDSSPELQVGVVRVGQLAGATGSGYWNADEHMVAVVRSSQRIGKFPDLKGVSQRHLMHSTCLSVHKANK